MFNFLRKRLLQSNELNPVAGDINPDIADEKNGREGAMSLNTRIALMSEVSGLPLGQHTKFYFANLKDPAKFAMELQSKLNEVPEPDYPEFGIVGFGLIARVVVDNPHSLHVDVQLTSSDCSHESFITNGVETKVREFLATSEAPQLAEKLTINTLPPDNSEIRGGPWGPNVMDSDVRLLWTDGSSQRLLLAAAGYAALGSMPDSVFREGLRLFQAFDGTPELEKIMNAADQIIEALAQKIPDYRSVDFRQVAQTNQAHMRQMPAVMNEE